MRLRHERTHFFNRLTLNPLETLTNSQGTYRLHPDGVSKFSIEIISRDEELITSHPLPLIQAASQCVLHSFGKPGEEVRIVTVETEQDSYRDHWNGAPGPYGAELCECPMCLLENRFPERMGEGDTTCDEYVGIHGNEAVFLGVMECA